MALDYSVILNKPDFGRQITDTAAQYAQMQAYKAQQAQAQQQQELQAQQAARAQEYLGALRSAESPQAMAQLAQQYPEQLEQLKGIAGFQNELQAQAVGEVAMNLSNLAQTDPQAAQAYLMENAEVLRTMGPGYEPEALIESLKTNPAEFAKRADMMGVISLGPEKAQEIIGQRQGREVTMRGQDITMRGQDISAATSAADRQQRATAAATSAAAKLQAASIAANADRGLSSKEIVSINKDLTAFNKDHGVMYEAANSLQTIRENDSSAAQVAAIFKFMKALDPTSVVREGEQIMVSRTDGIFGQLGNALNSVKTGQKLNENQLEDLQRTAALLANTQAETVNSTIDNYLGTFGDTIPEPQKRLLEKRKAPKLDIEGEAGPVVPGGPTPGVIEDGYRYKGGDPANPESWEQV